MNIGIYIYEQAEVLDFSGPFEVFSTASRICTNGNPFDVFLVGETAGTVNARAGYGVVAGYGFDEHPAIDVLIVAGGVHMPQLERAPVIDWIRRQAEHATITASVCTGVFLLAKALDLSGRRVTTYWEDIDDLRSLFPGLHVVEGVRWVDEDDIVTSGGISAGMDMSLHLVSRLHSRELAERTARQMELTWVENPQTRGEPRARSRMT